MRKSPRVPRVTVTVTAAEFDGFYATHFGDTVAMAYRLTADIDEARDITQEAFCRAWHRWPQLVEYDNPITWVRRVATNLAYSRWRHLRVATAHLARHKADDTAVAPPNLDHITIVAGLRKLPRDQCVALVLHHMHDLPVTQIADALDVPVGRVKMWLHRGRHALSAELDHDVKPSAPNGAVPTDQTAKNRKGRHPRRNTATRAAAAVLTILAVATATSAAQSTHRPQPSNEPARPARTAPTKTPDIALSWQGGELTISWTDPSDGNAQPTLLGSREDGQPQQVPALERGDTHAVIAGLRPADKYCFTVELVYKDHSRLPSNRVCIQQSPTRRNGRFEALTAV